MAQQQTFRPNRAATASGRQRERQRRRIATVSYRGRRRSVRYSLPLLGIWLGLVMATGFLALQNISVPAAKPVVAQSNLPLTKPAYTTPANSVVSAIITPRLSVAVPTPTPAPTMTPAPTSTPKPGLDRVIAASAERLKASLGRDAEFSLLVHNIETGEHATINGQKLFETASVYKLFVMLTVYNDISHGQLNLDDQVVLTSDAAAFEDDGGVLIVPIGQSLSVRDLLSAMIIDSNNTAALMLLFHVRAAHMKQVVADLGFKQSDLSDSYNFRTTTEDLDQFFQRLTEQRLLGSIYDSMMLNLLSRTHPRDRIAALLPDGTHVANKTGNISGVINDAGVIFLPNGQHLTVSVLIHQTNDGGAARHFISQISLDAYNYFSR